jgi:3'-phosphoadenosine 5'-phosphosulfate sulfotransferase
MGYPPHLLVEQVGNNPVSEEVEEEMKVRDIRVATVYDAIESKFNHVDNWGDLGPDHIQYAAEAVVDALFPNDPDIESRFVGGVGTVISYLGDDRVRLCDLHFRSRNDSGTGMQPSPNIDRSS